MPYRWCDLGEALLEDGQKEKARYCFQQAQKLAANLPPIWMMEETDAAIQCSAKVLTIVPDYAQVKQLLRPLEYLDLLPTSG